MGENGKTDKGWLKNSFLKVVDGESECQTLLFQKAPHQHINGGTVTAEVWISFFQSEVVEISY